MPLLPNEGPLWKNAYLEVLTEEDLKKLDWDSDEAGLEHTLLRRLAMNTLIPYCKGVGVDVGSQRCPITDTAIRIDHDQRFQHLQHITVGLSAFRNLDYIAASHVVEDWPNPIQLLKQWAMSLKVGGHIAMLMPHCKHYPLPGEPGCNPAHRYATYPETVEQWMGQLDRFKLVQLDACRTIRPQHPGMFDFDAVIQRMR